VCVVCVVVVVLYNLEAGRLAAYEKWIARTFDTSLFVSDTEAKAFKSSIHNQDNLRVIHNGVDYGFFNSDGEREGAHRHSGSDTLLFTGAMDYYPNIDAVTWFVSEVFPLVKQARPKTKFYIVGNNPVKAIKNFHKREEIFVTGYVEDIREYFVRASVFVAPFRIACGIQNKILEALSMGLPVVTTSIGCEGLKEIACPVLVRDEPEAFAQQIVSLLQRPRKISLESSRYRNWIIEHYDWQKNLAAMDTLFERSK